MKNFEKLLIDSIDEEIKGTEQERLKQVRDIFESEMLWENHDGAKHFKTRRLKDWLQGLCNTVSIPFTNHDILNWFKNELGIISIDDNTESTLVDDYWKSCAKTLYTMLYE